MKPSILSAAIIAALGSTSHAAIVHFGGRFDNPTSGYVDAIGMGLPGGFPTDDTGLSLGSPVAFSAPELFPRPEIVTVDMPNYGVVSMDFTSLVSWDVTPAGSFWTLGGSIDGTPGAFLSVNLVNPGFGVSSFGIEGTFAYTPPPVDPPPVNPPPVDPPPVCVVDCGGIPTPPPTAVPEASTCLMLLMGFVSICFLGRRRFA